VRARSTFGPPPAVDRRSHSQGKSEAAVASPAILGDSLAGAIGTAVSRIMGLGETIVVGAILGATYLGNTYQAINSLPNIVYYQLLAGSLFASLLVPPLVRHVDEGDREGALLLVQGFLGTLLLVAVVVSGILLAMGPVIMRLLTLGVSDHATAAAQSRVGWFFLIMFVPQIALYVIAGTGAAVMNAHGRFALAAAAPALEAIGMIFVLISAGVLFGTGTAITDVPGRQLLLLGLGTTSAVGLHAACQWLGARSSGVTLSPGAGWRDPEVRVVLRRIFPTLGYTGLAALQIFAVIIVANRVSGGLVAFQLALNFFYLPAALVTWPVARALLPQLARLHRDGRGGLFRDEFFRGVTLASFITIPIAAAYIVLASPLARAMAFGHLRTAAGTHMMAVSLATLGIGVVGETWFILGTYALYARHDVRSPLRSMAVRVGVALGFMVVAWMTRGPKVLVMLGLALSAGSLVGAVHIGLRLKGTLPRTPHSLFRSLGRTVTASLVMAAVTYLTALALGGLAHSHLSQIAVLAVTVLVGLAVYTGVQAAWRAPELGWLKTALSGFRPVLRAGR
jgi:putative peptidoglycan lipid II flippase